MVLSMLQAHELRGDVAMHTKCSFHLLCERIYVLAHCRHELSLTHVPGLYKATRA